MLCYNLVGINKLEIRQLNFIFPIIRTKLHYPFYTHIFWGHLMPFYYSNSGPYATRAHQLLCSLCKLQTIKYIKSLYLPALQHQHQTLCVMIIRECEWLLTTDVCILYHNPVVVVLTCVWWHTLFIVCIGSSCVSGASLCVYAWGGYQCVCTWHVTEARCRAGL